MSLVIKQKESFSAILLRCFGNLAEIMPSIFEFFATIGFIAVVSYMFYRVYGADPLITTVAGENALCMAIYYYLNNPMQNDFSCLEILQRTGCGFGLNDKWYNVLLKLAFNDNHTKLIEWLLLHRKVKLNKPSRASSVPIL